MADWDLTIYDRNGNPLAEVESDVTAHWRLNGYGWLEFNLSLSDPKVREGVFRFRNLVLFRHSSAGWWGGFLWTPRGWNKQTVTVRAYSAERLFQIRRGPANYTWNGSAGSIFKSIIGEANAPEDTRIREGSIWTGGTSRQETSRDDILLDAIQRIRERAGHDWYLEPELDDAGKLTFAAHWMEQAGALDMFHLTDGFNMTMNANDLLLNEQGMIINDVAFSGIGASLDERPRATWSDPDSQSLYGVCQGSENSDAEEVDTLLASAKAFVAENKAPKRLLSPVAEDRVYPSGMRTFASLRLGYSGRLSFSRVGFWGDGNLGVETTVRILEMELNTQTQLMDLVVQEV